MSTHALIRAATAADIAAVTDLLSQLNREEGYETSADAHAIASMFADARVTMRAQVAEVQGRIIGVALYYWGYDTVSASYGYHLADIIVTRSDRGKGVGTQLFNALAKLCLQEHGQWISLTVLKKNDDAKRFYVSRGMVEVKVDFFAIGPQGLARCTQGN